MQLREYAAFAHGRLWACKPTVSRHPYSARLSALRGLLCRGRYLGVTRQFEPLAHVCTQRQMRTKRIAGEHPVIAARVQWCGWSAQIKNPLRRTNPQRATYFHTPTTGIDQVPGVSTWPTKLIYR